VFGFIYGFFSAAKADAIIHDFCGDCKGFCPKWWEAEVSVNGLGVGKGLLGVKGIKYLRERGSGVIVSVLFSYEKSNINDYLGRQRWKEQ